MDSVPPREHERLAALQALRLLDTEAEAQIDAVCRIAAGLFGVAFCAVSLVASERVWFKAHGGPGPDDPAAAGLARAMLSAPSGHPRDGAFCGRAVLGDDLLVVEDARRDPAFADSPCVREPPHVRFYAGAPLSLHRGLNVGALCLMDARPRALTETERTRLRDLALIVVAHLRLQAASASRTRAMTDQQAAILGQLAEGVIVTDAAGRITFVNDAASAIHGVARLDVAPENYSDTYHLFTEDGQPYAPLALPLARAVRGETVRDARWRVRRPDGTEVLAIGCAQPLRDAQGAQIGAVLTLRDDTAREAAERSLRESEARLRALTDNMPSGMIFQAATARDGTGARLLDLSRSCERLIGLPAAGLLADAGLADALIVPEQRAAFRRAQAAAIRDCAVFDAEVQFRHAGSGELRWNRIVSRPRPMPDGSLVWDGLQTDITDQKQAEAALRDLAATLSERVEARTREAETARAQAEAASRAKSDFLATMSHEIRTPLNGILGYADLLLDLPADDPRLRGYTERVRAAGSALLTIVNDILDFSRVEAGGVELVSVPFTPLGLVEEALAIVRTAAEDKGLRLSLAADAGIPDAVLGDRDRLRQVLLNLLNNAIKFTREGGVTLKLASSEVGATARLRLCVHDTGIGIAPAKHALLFQRFSQIDGTVQREFGGTGLGLAISKGLVERMGGTIGLESAPGRGSVFWFEIDLPLAAASPIPVPARPVHAPGGRPARRVLLVEDVALNQDLARAVLALGGYAVDVVCGGAEAVRAVQAAPYDVVLMDIQMPGIDGITATRLIRGLDHPAAAVPIVAMTANVFDHQVEAYRTAGMQDHVAKPFDRAHLFATIERCARDPAARPTDAVGPARRSAGGDATDDLDRDAFADAVAAIGRGRVDRLLAGLARELGERLGADGTLPARAPLARDAHAMIPAAATLGFTGLARLCREIEDACAAGEAYEALVGRLHAARRRTIHTIDALRTA